MSRGPAYDSPASNSGEASSSSPSLEERGRRRARAATTPIPASPSSSSSSALPVGPLSPALTTARSRVLAGVRLRPSPARPPSYGSASSAAAAATPLRASFEEADPVVAPAAPATRRTPSPLPPASSPIAIPGAAERNRVHRRRTVGDAASGSGSGSGSDDDLFGGFSAEELSAQATRLRERIGVGRGWVDPAGRLRALPHGARLPPPPTLTEEDLARARALSPAYPRGPSPPPPPPQTEEEYMRGVEERANEYHAF
ncbi:hypothetical protein CGCS363_v009812 [Colletotrichum siamense]|uniref:uncharacterized protein n=1 Tax=Colletotrichum siamense TaxID=690259 RepID=UPI0018721E17|nr:uncharacterized protein CGCS363_v009812 [Colletotrichum siamense]KAF5494785.1 hypothetical protein CGCS363_v009812 [Colletotrichum siamense]